MINQSEHYADTLTCVYAVQEILQMIAYTLSTAIAYLCVIENTLFEQPSLQQDGNNALCFDTIE